MGGVGLDKYDEIRQLVAWETIPPVGGIFHVAAHDGSKLRITDVWQSAEDLQRFVDERLTPGVQQAGLTAQPTVEVYPAHAVYAPGYISK